MVDAIRNLPENKAKYDYCDANGYYIPQYGESFGDCKMWINVNKGMCLTEWVLLNTMFSIIGVAIPQPYGLMFSVVSPMLLQQHPGATSFSGADILKEYVLYLLDEKKMIPKGVSIAISAFSLYDSIASGTSCSNNCYNVSITIIIGKTCYQVKYHFSGGAETLARTTEYLQSGAAPYDPDADYIDNVNERYYDVY
jgi:hypothetical protein